jgi:putative DNA primase/helicase
VDINGWISCTKNKWDNKPENQSPKNCVALSNGVLCLEKLFAGAPEKEYLIPHTPEWFSTICLPYGYDSTAKCPTWQWFLNEVFSGDIDAIETLQRWIGYLLIDDMSLEKILFVIGRPRSGKGTIMKTIIELLGRSSVASPSLNSFADQYFLHSLIGKAAVVIPDVRLSRRADNVVITERLLSISGRDPQDIQRKYLDTLNGVPMQCRFTLFSNMLPYLEDHSAAFVSRCIFLSMPNTYYGKEDPQLFVKIRKEMPGILNWAIVGRHRLEEDARNGIQPLVQPNSGAHLLRQMNVMTAPVSVFLQDRTDMTEDTYSVSTHDLFEEYCRWCGENDRVKKIDQEQFRRSVRDVYPNLVVKTLSYAGKTESRIFGMLIKENVLV